uniref:Putative secreted protein n=1 Tax=Ixodes ricinus TaxID=34613 RepID=A0A6B0U9B9_IXORI
MLKPLGRVTCRGGPHVLFLALVLPQLKIGSPSGRQRISDKTLTSKESPSLSRTTSRRSRTLSSTCIGSPT